MEKESNRSFGVFMGYISNVINSSRINTLKNL